ncbi:MAG: TonB-dependent siderophore receptor [Pseudomonadota bacterium]
MKNTFPSVVAVMLSMTWCASTAAAQNAAADSAPGRIDQTVVVTGLRDAYAPTNASSATRSDTPLIDIPQSIQVVTRALIDSQDSRTLADALVNVSGVVASKPEEGLLVGPLVRGFPAEIYQDGLPMFGATQAANDPTSLVGIERIEVLKGPVSTLYGGGLGSPLGGLINIESARPGASFGGFVALRGGSYATGNPYGELNLPLTATVAARIAAEYQDNASWIDRLKAKRWLVQPSVSFQFDPRTDLLLQGQFSRRSQLEYSGLPAAQALDGKLDRYAFPGAPLGQPATTTNNNMVTAILRHALTDGARLAVSARHYRSNIAQYGSLVQPDFYPSDPATPTVYAVLPMNMRTKVKESTLDANLSTASDLLGARHALLLGFDVDNTRLYSDMGFNGRSVGSLDLANPLYDLAYGALTAPDLTQHDHYRTMALYAQDQASYGRLHLTASLRYTRLQFSEREQATDQTYHRASPRLGASFEFAPGVALYAGYASAFRGAFGLLGLQTPKPETSRNVEAGLKFALTSARLSGTIAAFDQTRDNVATPDPAHPLWSIQAGRQRARGVEMDLAWEPYRAFALLANYAYTDAGVRRDNVIPVGDRLARVARHSARLAARYRLRTDAYRTLSFGAGVSATGARQLTLPNTVALPGYAVLDMQAAYDVGRYTLSFSARNLAGRKVFDTYQYFAFPVVMPIQPRSAYLALTARF